MPLPTALERPWWDRGPLGMPVGIDASWYIRIAAQGYTYLPGKSPAFFPLFPLVIRLFAIGGHFAFTAWLLSFLFYLAAMVLLAFLVTSRFGTQTAIYTVWTLSSFPTTYVFQAAYTESLFLLLTSAAFLAVYRGKWGIAGLLGGLAAMTRSTGVGLLLPLLGLAADSRVRWRVLWLILIPVGLGMVMLIDTLSVGDPLAFTHAQQAWQRHLQAPWLPLIQTFHLLGDIFPPWFHGHMPGARNPLSMLPVDAFILIITFLTLAICWRRIGLWWSLWGLVLVGFPLLEASAISPLYSYSRYVLVAFPLAVGIATFPHYVRILYFSLSWPATLYFSALYTLHYWIS